MASSFVDLLARLEAAGYGYESMWKGPKRKRTATFTLIDPVKKMRYTVEAANPGEAARKAAELVGIDPGVENPDEGPPQGTLAL